MPEAIPCPYTFHKSGTLFPEAGRYAEMHLAEKYRLRMDFLLVHDGTCCQSRREMSHIAQLYMMPFGKVIGNAAFQCSKHSLDVSGSKTGCL